jgi:hypothetical protein
MPSGANRKEINRVMKCSISQCNRKVLARGWCSRHYQRWRGHGDPVAGGTIKGAGAKFIEDSLLTNTDECILWPFGRHRMGYAKAYFGPGESRQGHRIVCKKAYGPAPSPKHDAAHSCRGGYLGCINWRHLRWATRKENIADATSQGTIARGHRHPSVKLTEQQVRQIRALRHKMSGRQIAKQFGLGHSSVRSIFSGRNWGWLP